MRLKIGIILLLLACLIIATVEGKKNHKKSNKQYSNNQSLHPGNQSHHHSKYGKDQKPNHDVKLVVVRETIAVVGLLLCLAGSRILKVTLFMGGFVLMFMFAYLTLPSIIDNDTCCGTKGNWIARIGVCVILGILGGVLTLVVYYVGIFAIGGIFGMICALLALSTPLAEKEFFDTAMGVGLFYGAFVIVGGLLALLLKTIAVALATSVGGSYAVFYGVDYFAKTNFSAGIEVLIIQIQEHIRDEFGLGAPHGHHPNFFRQYTMKDGVIFVFFCVLAIMGFVLQMYLASSDKELKKIKECKNCTHCNQNNSEYLLEYIKALHASKQSQLDKESLLKH